MQSSRLRTENPAVVTLEDIVGKTTDLPSLPAATLAVMRAANSADASAATVARFISHDQSLAVRVLRLANSAYYGLPRKVGNVQEAVVILGLRCIRNLSLVASTYPWLSRPLRGYDLGPKDFWAHAMGVAVGSQLIAERTRIEGADQAFTAGLLHDLGKVAMSVWLERKLPALVYMAKLQEVPFDRVERQVFGFDHQEVGAHMARAWNLPESIVLCMSHHHCPDTCEPSSPLVDVVHLADQLTNTMGLGLGGDGAMYDLSTGALERIGMSLEDLEALAEPFMKIYSEHDEMFKELDK